MGGLLQQVHGVDPWEGTRNPILLKSHKQDVNSPTLTSERNFNNHSISEKPILAHTSLLWWLTGWERWPAYPLKWPPLWVGGCLLGSLGPDSGEALSLTGQDSCQPPAPANGSCGLSRHNRATSLLLGAFNTPPGVERLSVAIYSQLHIVSSAKVLHVDMAVCSKGPIKSFNN